jgi:hypothetical protein
MSADRNTTILHNPTVAEAYVFIERGRLERLINPPSTICVVAANDFKMKAEKSGLRCGKVCVCFYYKDDLNIGYHKGGNHAFNFFETSDLGTVWFDSQKELCLPSAWVSLETFLQIEYGNIALISFYIVF